MYPTIGSEDQLSFRGGEKISRARTRVSLMRGSFVEHDNPPRVHSPEKRYPCSREGRASRGGGAVRPPGDEHAHAGGAGAGCRSRGGRL